MHACVCVRVSVRALARECVCVRVRARACMCICFRGNLGKPETAKHKQDRRLLLFPSIIQQSAEQKRLEWTQFIVEFYCPSRTPRLQRRQRRSVKMSRERKKKSCCLSVMRSASKSTSEPFMQAAKQAGRQAFRHRFNQEHFRDSPGGSLHLFFFSPTLIHPGSLLLVPYAGKEPQLRTKWR